MGLLAGGVTQRWEIKTVRLWLIRVAGKYKGKQAVDLKVTGEVSPSGRMAIVGR